MGSSSPLERIMSYSRTSAALESQDSFVMIIYVFKEYDIRDVAEPGTALLDCLFDRVAADRLFVLNPELQAQAALALLVGP